MSMLGIVHTAICLVMFVMLIQSASFHIIHSRVSGELSDIFRITQSEKLQGVK